MSNKLLQTLKHKNLINRGKVNIGQIQSMSIADILDLAQESVEVTSLEHIEPERSFFTHSSSISLAGGTFPCSGMDCRSRHLEELALFAAMYSDRVYIRNYFSEYLQHGFTANDEDDLKVRFSRDINLLLQISPLLDEGKIVPVTAPNHCIHCFVGNSFGVEVDERLEFVEEKLIRLYNQDIKYSVFLEDKNLVLKTTGPELLLEHTTYKDYSKIPSQIKKNQMLMSKLKAGSEVILSRAIVKQLEEDKRLAYRTLANITFDLLTSQQLGTSFLTERTIDAQTLTEIFSDINTERRNRIIQKYLTCLVPVVGNIDLVDLIQLRKKEEDAFIVFRNVLGKTVDEYIKNNKEFTERDAKQIYGDVLQPQVAKLNTRVQSAKRHFVKNSSAKVVSWVGAISLGVYLGLLPSEFAAVAGALGLVPLIANVTNEILARNNSEDEIRKEDVYFLWKITQQT